MASQRKEKKKIEFGTPEFLKLKLIKKVSKELTKPDHKLLEFAIERAKNVCKRGRHHTFCAILDDKGKYHEGIQQTYKRAADIETCSEVVAIGNLNLAQRNATTVVTIHFLPKEGHKDDGIITIVPPCYRCATRLIHLEKTQKGSFEIIVPYKDKLLKIKPEYSFLLQYPVDYNQDGTSTIK